MKNGIADLMRVCTADGSVLWYSRCDRVHSVPARRLGVPSIRHAGPVGGAAARPYPEGVQIAPLRAPSALPPHRGDSIDGSPCDPWPEARIGYGSTEILLPPVRSLERLRTYLDTHYPRRCAR